MSSSFPPGRPPARIRKSVTKSPSSRSTDASAVHLQPDRSERLRRGGRGGAPASNSFFARGGEADMSALLDLLLAPRCAGCDEPGSWLCVSCRDLCEPVRRGRLHAAASYGGAVARAIHRFKYRGERALARELGALVASCVARDLAAGSSLDAVVPAVLHRERVRERGYDQAALL